MSKEQSLDMLIDPDLVSVESYKVPTALIMLIINYVNYVGKRHLVHL